MPFSRISLLRGKSERYLTELSDNLHLALTQAFDVPERDRFQAIHQHEPHELVFDRDYLAGPRSDDFVLIAISAGRPRSTAVKEAFYRRLVELLADAPGLRPEDVMVIITTTDRDEWSFGGGRAQMIERIGRVAPTTASAEQPGAALPRTLTIRAAVTPAIRSPAGISSEPFWLDALLETAREGESTAIRASFDPGVRTHWHTHPLGQLLYVLSGQGQVERRGGDIHAVGAGDCVWFAPGEPHWHGATATSMFSYLSVQAVQDGSAVTWLEPVTIAEPDQAA